jgi:hypothetical protein
MTMLSKTVSWHAHTATVNALLAFIANVAG